MRKNFRHPLTALLAAGVLTFGLAACGGDDAATTSQPAADAQSAPQAEAQPVAALTDLTGKQTQVIVAESFLAGLESLKVTPGVVGDATLKDGTLAFPITDGSATYYEPGSRTPYVESNIQHKGSGISLTAGDTTVELTNFVVDAGKSILTGDVSANGESVVKNAPLFFLDGRTLDPLQTDEEAGTATLEGTTVSLTAEAAELLNKTFKTDALAEYFTVGSARITLALPA